MEQKKEQSQTKDYLIMNMEQKKEQSQTKDYLIAVVNPNKYLIRYNEYDAKIISEALEEMGFVNRVFTL